MNFSGIVSITVPFEIKNNDVCTKRNIDIDMYLNASIVITNMYGGIDIEPKQIANKYATN